MRIIKTNEHKPSRRQGWDEDQIYNGLDCCITREIFDAISPQLDNHTSATYHFSQQLQGPVLDMRLRGVRVDLRRRAEVLDEYFETLDRLEADLGRIAFEGLGLDNFKWSSTKDLKELFYGRLHIPEIRSKGHVSVDVNALEKMEQYIVARALVRYILAMRELQKRIAFLRTPLDSDGRMRTSYNIAGTNTGRFSSSLSEFGTGGNLQNVEEILRSIFISDPGMKFAKLDAKSGESYVVGAIEWNLFRDGTYLDAVDSGDVHTAVARICWPNLAWTGDVRRDKDLAERPYYRHYSYRFMCKKLGHGSNYGGQPFTLAQQSRLPIRVVQEFQPKYFGAFPAHRQWQQWVAQTLQRDGYLVSLTNRKRWFHGRRSDPTTVREAIAYDPQGSLADIVNTAMLRLWVSPPKGTQLMMQDHDALTFQYPEELEDEIVPELRKRVVVKIGLEEGRVMAIPYDCKTGWNKGEYHSTNNPEGLKDYEPGDKRERQAQVGILDRPVRRSHG